MHTRLAAPAPLSAAVADRLIPSPTSPVASDPAEGLRERAMPGGLTPGALLEHADAEHWRVAVVGGSPAQREELHRRMVADRPGVALIGHWTPVHPAIRSRQTSLDIAEQIRHAEADLVVVCLQTHQTDWIDTYGDLTGARALLAVDALGDLLTDRVPRILADGARGRLDKMWRLALEPKRWAKRYLVEGPPASQAVRRSSAPHDA